MLKTKIQSLLPGSTRDKGLMAAVCGSLLISFDAVFIRLSGTGGVDTVFLFGLFTALSMATIIQITDDRGIIGTLQEGGLPLVLSSLLILGSASSFVLSVKYTTVANTMIIMSGRPVLTAIVAWLALGEKPSDSLWTAMVGVIIGIGLVVHDSLNSPHLLGDGFAFLAVTCLAMNGTLWRRYKTISRFAIIGLAGFFMAVVMFIPSRPSDYSLATWLIMAAMGLGSAPLGRVLNAVSTRYLPAAEAALIALGNVVTAPLWVFLLFQERPSLSALAGGVIAMTSIVSFVIRSRKAAPA